MPNGLNCIRGLANHLFVASSMHCCCCISRACCSRPFFLFLFRWDGWALLSLPAIRVWGSSPPPSTVSCIFGSHGRSSKSEHRAYKLGNLLSARRSPVSFRGRRKKMSLALTGEAKLLPHCERCVPPFPCLVKRRRKKKVPEFYFERRRMRSQKLKLT